MPEATADSAKAIYEAYEEGCMFDAWSDYFDVDKWHEILERNGISLDFYVYRQRPLDEVLPWDFIDVGVRKEFLYANGSVRPSIRW